MARDTTLTNRIQELREAAGLTQDELAQRMGIPKDQVGRHERGERRVTIQWAARYAQALGVTPVDIVVASEIIEPRSELEAATVDGMPGLSAAIALRGLKVYRVLQSMVPDAGIATGDIVTIDSTEAAVAAVKAGDVVQIQVGTSAVMWLRQFVPPALVVTNMPGARNTALRLDDKSARLGLVGVVINAR